jgi:hypothetical protein
MPKTVTHDRWELVLTDCIEHMHTMDRDSVDLSVFSPPFPAIYAYSASERDLGNVDSLTTESAVHFGFFFDAIRRIIKPGRVMVVHCCQIPRMKRTGGVGLHDFRGMLIRLAERAGFVFEYDWLVRKNPQSQALRTKSRELQFAGLEADRAASRGALGDYLLKFRTPGENAVPIRTVGTREVSREDWIQWAEPAWMDIRETETLNVRVAKGESDTKHICPLQLEVIRRLVLLYSNRDELVFSPFAGIGSEGYVALKWGRRFLGCELKAEYFEEACRNLSTAENHEKRELSLFDAVLA